MTAASTSKRRYWLCPKCGYRNARTSQRCTFALADGSRRCEGEARWSSTTGGAVVAADSHAANRQENKIAVALAAREAMREYRKGKPIAFQTRVRP